MQIIYYFVVGIKVNFTSAHYTIYAVGRLSAPSFLIILVINQLDAENLVL